MLWIAEQRFDVRLSYFCGGNLRNAIPREAYAIFGMPEEDAKLFEVEFEQFAKGFLEEMSDCTEKEIELLPFSAKLLTYECGIRFLADYLNGDTYFKIHREHHNLDRARNQLKLVYDIGTKEEEMKEIVKNLL